MLAHGPINQVGIGNIILVNQKEVKVEKVAADYLFFVHIFIASEKNPKLHFPPSLPTPESLTPPNGTLKSLCSHVLIQIIPVWIDSATLLPFSRSLVHILPANPYLVLLAISIASFSVLNL